MCGEKFLGARLIIKVVESALVVDLGAKRSVPYFRRVFYLFVVLVFVILLFFGFYLYTETESHTLVDWIVIAEKRNDYVLLNEMLRRAFSEGVGLDEVITIRPNWFSGSILIGLSGVYGFFVVFSLVVRVQTVRKAVRRVMPILSISALGLQLSPGQVRCPFCGGSRVVFVGMPRCQCLECQKEFRVIDAESLLVYAGLGRILWDS